MNSFMAYKNSSWKVVSSSLKLSTYNCLVAFQLNQRLLSGVLIIH